MAENENINNSTLHYFEGVEKLLEIWFAPSPTNKNADLRKIPRHVWDALLKIVRCEIISFSKNEHIDAYVLSESSMFVSKRRWILKTCGTTTPLQCLEPLLELAEKMVGYTEIEDLFYSRKNFKRPELQVSPHRGFEEEVELLDSFFDDGHAYCLGSVNRDCWYLYTVNRGNNTERIGMRIEELTNGDTNGIVQTIPKRIEEIKSEPEPDQTLEILMTELDSEIMSIFTKDECVDGKEATEKSGIHKLIPSMVIDDYLFEPCGYSMNGITKNNSAEHSQGCYMTIHITPEPEFSYVSFETNYAPSNYRDLITRVIDTFQPGKFLVTIFANKTSSANVAFRDVDHAKILGDWQRRDIQYCRFPTYDLTYAQYSKFPS